MALLPSLLLVLLGLVLVVKGADWLVSGASALARRHQVSELVIGLTVVAFGTSAPELAVNVVSSISGANGVTLGNVIGSNLFNVLLILGIAGLIRPLAVRQETVRREIPLSLLAAALVFVLASDRLILRRAADVLSRFDGAVLLACFAGFLVLLWRTPRTGPAATAQPTLGRARTTVYIALGLVGLFLGGRLLVGGAVGIARALGITERVIGLTLVAAGTSVPELATSVVAAMRGRDDIAVGNVIGSNVFNVFFVLGVSALIRPVPWDPRFGLDLALLAAGTLFLLLAVFTGTRHRLDRWEAATLLGFYAVYTALIVLRP